MKKTVAAMALWLPWIALCVVTVVVWWVYSSDEPLEISGPVLVDTDTLLVVATVILPPLLDTMESVMMDTCCYAYYLDGRLLLIHPSPRLYYIHHDLMILVSRDEMNWFLHSVGEEE